MTDRSFSYHSKMLAAVLMISVICTTVGFNVFPNPVYNFTSEDPLFGQTIVQSRNGIFVPSPTTGEVFRCTQQKCSSMNIAAKVRKGLRPIASAASSLSEDTEQLLVCNQVRAMNKSSENFNGNCTYVSDMERFQIYPAKLASDQLDKNNTNNNNNNKHQGKSTYLDQGIGHMRVRREAVQNSANTDKDDDDDDDDEDAGTEIAFVLDGSGSIDHIDFEKAKHFISSVMTNVWATCFSCNFGIVQFGRNISTELSLKENNDSAQALEKVQNIKQLGEVTKTASALYHVLKDIFVPESGSNVNARKIIILLSDGEMLGDTMNLSTVLNMAEMKDITRFAIGVGPAVLNRPKAIQEMIEIAGSRERFYNVSNYHALTEILASLENNIFDIEGSKTGAGLKFQLAQAGFSSHITQEGSMLFGAVGAYDWSGGIILRRNDDLKFLNATQEEPRFSYLGYSVTSANVATKTLYISGAPRYNLSGAVFIFNESGHDVLLGDQIGSYFGSVLCTLDINNDKDTDLLLVGAPMFHEKGEEGKVLVYMLHQGKFERQDYELRGAGNHIYARFGAAIADIGDIDGDKYRDIAVGAPLEESDDHPDSCLGSVYIYNGFNIAIRQPFSQRITPSDFKMKLVHFGQALSVMSGSESKTEISVGSKGAITVFKIIPVIKLTAKINIQTEFKAGENEPVIPYDLQTQDKSIEYGYLEICFDVQRGRINSGELPMVLQISLDHDHKENRLITQTPGNNFKLTVDLYCMEPIKLIYKGCYDCFSPIKIKVNFSLAKTEIPLRLLDKYSVKEATTQIPFERECKEINNCKAIISLADSKLSTDIITIGTSQTVDITFNLNNTGDSSYMTILVVTYPEMLQPKKKDSNCEVNNDNHQIICKLLHPVFKTNAQTGVTIAWLPTDRKSEVNTSMINARILGGTEELDSKNYEFKVRNALALQLTGTANPQRLSVTEGEESNRNKELQFIFKLLGENKYKAQITVSITIKIQARHTNFSNIIVEPKNCSIRSEKHNYLVVCTLTELRQITITADTLIKDVGAEIESITAQADLFFDENFYDGKDIMKTLVVEVSVFKLQIVKENAYIIGSAVGGFILLFIIIIILIKCGFFRRRHQMDRI